MLRWTLVALLPLAACAPPPENQAVADNEASVEANAESEGGAENAAAPAVANAAGPADTAAPASAPAPPAAAAGEPYTARGQEPGWALKIDRGRIDYQGNYGEKKINVAAPAPQPLANGRRYVTERLTVAITYKRCNDAMSGHGYEHEVKVTADGETYDGCGGPRRSDWDM
jgi:uncharacterized membrane protein